MCIKRVALSVLFLFIGLIFTSCSAGQVSADVSPQSGAGWSYRGVFDRLVVSPGSDVTGFEFTLHFDADTGKFNAQPRIGDCDKIDYYILTDHAITIAVNKKYDLRSKKGSVAARVMINLVSGGRGEYEDEYGKFHGQGTVYSDAGGDQLIHIDFGRNYATGEIRDLLYIWGNIE